MENKMENKHEEFVRQVREIGESLFKNAESIVGTEECLRGIYISVNLEHHEIPAINVDRSFYPEKYIERMAKE